MPDLSLELALLREGVSPIAGADEAGRGPIAGPVVAAAVILSPDLRGDEEWLSLLDDSKRLTRIQRERAFAAVQEYALDWAVAVIDSREIDRVGIGVAALRAMMQAVDSLRRTPAHLLLDYVPVRQCSFPYDTVKKGDSRSYSIAAASNVAKVTRDSLMHEYESVFPGYGFARHKGYATRQHLEHLREVGPCSIHRRSFAPVAQSRLTFPERMGP